MKTTQLLSLLIAGISAVSVTYAVQEKGEGQTGSIQSAAPYTEIAENLAKDSTVSMDRICQAVANAVKNDSVAPSVVFARVVGARESWTTGQLAGLYKTVLMSSPALAQSFATDVKAFEDAGKPSVVESGAPEGVKLLASLYGSQVPALNADAVLLSLASDSVGSSVLAPIPLLRSVLPPASPARRSQPAKPTPPLTSPEN